MSSLSRRAAGRSILCSTLLIALAAPAMAQLPSEMPASFVPRVESFDYTEAGGNDSDARRRQAARPSSSFRAARTAPRSS